MKRWTFTKICILTGAGMSAVRLIAALLFGEDLSAKTVAPAIVIPIVMLVFGIILDVVIARRRKRERRTGAQGR
jgi:multidrug transporter EmrE-like cation transporter